MRRAAIDGAMRAAAPSLQPKGRKKCSGSLKGDHHRRNRVKDEATQKSANDASHGQQVVAQAFARRFFACKPPF